MNENDKVCVSVLCDALRLVPFGARPLATSSSVTNKRCINDGLINRVTCIHDMRQRYWQRLSGSSASRQHYSTHVKNACVSRSVLIGDGSGRIESDDACLALLLLLLLSTLNDTDPCACTWL